MLYPNTHKVVRSAGMYAGIADSVFLGIDDTLNSLMSSGMPEEVAQAELKKQFIGYDLTTGYAKKQPVLPVVGYVSSIPLTVSLVGPGYAVAQTEVNGHKVTSDIATEALAEYLTTLAKASGVSEVIEVIDEGSIYPQT